MDVGMTIFSPQWMISAFFHLRKKPDFFRGCRQLFPKSVNICFTIDGKSKIILIRYSRTLCKYKQYLVCTTVHRISFIFHKKFHFGKVCFNLDLADFLRARFLLLFSFPLQLSHQSVQNLRLAANLTFI